MVINSERDYKSIVYNMSYLKKKFLKTFRCIRYFTKQRRRLNINQSTKSISDFAKTRIK